MLNLYLGCNPDNVYECSPSGEVCDYGPRDSCKLCGELTCPSSSPPSQPPCDSASLFKRDGKCSSCACQSCTKNLDQFYCTGCDSCYCGGCFGSSNCARCVCNLCTP